MTTEIQPTRVAEFIKQMMPWAHGHQIKAITKWYLGFADSCPAFSCSGFANRKMQDRKIREADAPGE